MYVHELVRMILRCWFFYKCLQCINPFILAASTSCSTQIGNLQAVAQFLCNASKSVSGVIGDLLSPARMIIFGTLLTTMNKPMFALSGGVTAVFGTTAALYWITFGKVWYSSMRPLRC